MTENSAFLRKLNAQELGFRKEEPGKAGRYILVSKKCLSYFPPLSNVITNDHLFLTIVSPQSRKIILCKFVYHNDKITLNKPHGRDEFRIYLNSEVDSRSSFQPEDILVFYRTLIDCEIVYRLFHFPVGKKGPEYRKLDDLLKTSEGAGAHALIPVNRIPFMHFEKASLKQEKIIPEEIKNDAFKDPIRAEVAEEDRVDTTRLIRSTSFRDLVLFFYNYKCAATKEVIRYNNLINLEAAHIIPRHMGGGNNPSNGLALNRDLHWAFDKGFFTIESSFTVKIHSEVAAFSTLRAIHERQIYLPKDERATPHPESLKWHNEKVFGLFKKFY